VCFDFPLDINAQGLIKLNAKRGRAWKMKLIIFDTPGAFQPL
jgi:hypothetical protein